MTTVPPTSGSAEVGASAPRLTVRRAMLSSKSATRRRVFSACIAVVAVYAFILLIENFMPWLHQLRDGTNMALIVLGIVVLGIGISVISTHRSVLKYLKMKLDDLY